MLAESCIASAEKDRILKKRSTHTIEHMEDVNNSFVNSFPIADQRDRDRDRDSFVDHSSSSSSSSSEAHQTHNIQTELSRIDGSPANVSVGDKDSSFIDISFSEFSVLNSSMEGGCQSPDSPTRDVTHGSMGSHNRSRSGSKRKKSLENLEDALKMSPIVSSSGSKPPSSMKPDDDMMIEDNSSGSVNMSMSMSGEGAGDMTDMTRSGGGRSTRYTRRSSRTSGCASSSSSMSMSQQDALNWSMKRKHVNISGYDLDGDEGHDEGQESHEGHDSNENHDSSENHDGNDGNDGNENSNSSNTRGEIIYSTSSYNQQDGHLLSESGFTDRDEVSLVGTNGMRHNTR